MFTYNKNVDSKIGGIGIKRKVLSHGGSLMVVEVSFEKGSVGDNHVHPHEQVGYVKKGVFEFEINGEKRTIGEGDSVYIPPNVDHGCVAMEEGIIIDVFTPQREDFLK